MTAGSLLRKASTLTYVEWPFDFTGYYSYCAYGELTGFAFDFKKGPLKWENVS